MKKCPILLLSLIIAVLFMAMTPSQKAYADVDLRLAWGSGLSTELDKPEQLLFVTFITPELLLGYRFYNQRLGLYLDLSYQYYTTEYSNFTKDKEFNYDKHYLSWGVLLSYYFRAQKTFSPYISVGLGSALQWVKEEFQPIEQEIKATKAHGNIILIPKFVLGLDWYLVNKLTLGFNVGFSFNLFSHYKGKLLKESYGQFISTHDSTFYGSQILFNLVLGYQID